VANKLYSRTTHGRKEQLKLGWELSGDATEND
jgi:hypothetical protein